MIITNLNIHIPVYSLTFKNIEKYFPRLFGKIFKNTDTKKYEINALLYNYEIHYLVDESISNKQEF